MIACCPFVCANVWNLPRFLAHITVLSLSKEGYSPSFSVFLSVTCRHNPLKINSEPEKEVRNCVGSGGLQHAISLSLWRHFCITSFLIYLAAQLAYILALVFSLRCIVTNSPFCLGWISGQKKMLHKSATGIRVRDFWHVLRFWTNPTRNYRVRVDGSNYGWLIRPSVYLWLKLDTQTQITTYPKNLS